MLDSLFSMNGAALRDARKRIKTLERSLRKAGRGDDAARVAELHDQIAFAKLSIQDYRGAIESWFELVAVHHKTGERKPVARAYSNIGAAYREMGDLQNAEVNVRKAAAIDEQIGDRRGVMIGALNRGILAMDKGEYPAAAADFRLAYQEAEAARDVEWAGWLLKSIGEAELRGYELRTAVDTLEAGLNAASSAGDGYLAVETARLLAEAYLQAGVYFSCQACLDDARECARQLGVENLEGAVVADLARFHLVLSDVAKARELTDEARKLMTGDAPPRYLLLVDRNMGRVHTVQAGALNGARKYLTTGLARAKEIRSRRLQAEFHLLLADVEFRGEKMDECEAEAGQAMRLAELAQDRVQLAESRIMLGRVYQKRHQAAQSQENRMLAVEAADQLTVPELHWRAHYYFGRCLVPQHELAEAERHFGIALATLESARESLRTNYLVGSYFDSRERAEVYKDMVLLLRRQGKIPEALHWLARVGRKDVHDQLAALFRESA